MKLKQSKPGAAGLVVRRMCDTPQGTPNQCKPIDAKTGKPCPGGEHGRIRASFSGATTGTERFDYERDNGPGMEHEDYGWYVGYLDGLTTMHSWT
jgi:hypothetical protein